MKTRKIAPPLITVGELIEVLGQYDKDVLISGLNRKDEESILCTVQGQYIDLEIQSVGIYFHAEADDEESFIEKEGGEKN